MCLLMSLDDRSVKLAICYYVELPELFRADVMLVPTANILPCIDVATYVVTSRVEGNEIYPAYANQGVLNVRLSIGDCFT